MRASRQEQQPEEHHKTSHRWQTMVIDDADSAKFAASENAITFRMEQ